MAKSKAQKIKIATADRYVWDPEIEARDHSEHDDPDFTKGLLYVIKHGGLDRASSKEELDYRCKRRESNKRKLLKKRREND